VARNDGGAPRTATAKQDSRNRVSKFDLEYCPLCGGTLKIIAAIEAPAVITRILSQLGLPTSHLRYAFPASPAVRPSLPG
jgi:hypothetical protein